VNVVYLKVPAEFLGAYAIAALTSAGEIVLTPAVTFSVSPLLLYAANNGWIAYLRPNGAGFQGPLEVWRRSPTGQEAQVNFFAVSSFIEALGPSGEVVFFSEAEGTRRRYLAVPGGVPEDIGSGLGRPLFIGGQLHVIEGNTLFRVE
jgi:hypothetical protein